MTQIRDLQLILGLVKQFRVLLGFVSKHPTNVTCFVGNICHLLTGIGAAFCVVPLSFLGEFAEWPLRVINASKGERSLLEPNSPPKGEVYDVKVAP